MGGTGDDEIHGGVGVDTIDGGEGNDDLRGGRGNDIIEGGAGNDTIYGDADATGLASTTVTGTATSHKYIVHADGQHVATEKGDSDKPKQGGKLTEELDGGDVLSVQATEGMVNVHGGEGLGVYSDHDNHSSDNKAISDGEGLVFKIGEQEAFNSASGGNLHLQRLDAGETAQVTLLRDGDIVGQQTVVGNDLTDKSDVHVDLSVGLSAGEAFDTIKVETVGSGQFYFKGISLDAVTTTAGSDDRLLGGAGDDDIYGGGGNDVLKGGSGVDDLYGGSGNDRLKGGKEWGETIDGGFGTDTADYSGGTAEGTGLRIDLNAGYAMNRDAFQDKDTRHDPELRDELVSIENANGSKYNDTIVGNDADNVLRGGAGTDHLHGGEGSDTADFRDVRNDSGTGIEVDLSETGNSGFSAVRIERKNGATETDYLKDIENVRGTRYDDNMTGNDSDNTFNGGRGNDVLDGGGGDDVLKGGKGDDHLFGGTGDDVLKGGKGDDRLYGEAGEDLLKGGKGDDFLDGGEGADRLLGGSGNDVLVFDEADFWTDDGDDIVYMKKKGRDENGDRYEVTMETEQAMEASVASDAQAAYDASIAHSLSKGKAANLGLTTAADLVDSGHGWAQRQEAKAGRAMDRAESKAIKEEYGREQATYDGGRGFDALDVTNALGNREIDLTGGKIRGIEAVVDTGNRDVEVKVSLDEIFRESDSDNKNNKKVDDPFDDTFLALGLETLTVDGKGNKGWDKVDLDDTKTLDEVLDGDALEQFLAANVGVNASMEVHVYTFVDKKGNDVTIITDADTKLDITTDVDDMIVA